MIWCFFLPRVFLAILNYWPGPYEDWYIKKVLCINNYIPQINMEYIHQSIPKIVVECKLLLGSFPNKNAIICQNQALFEWCCSHGANFGLGLAHCGRHLVLCFLCAWTTGGDKKNSLFHNYSCFIIIIDMEFCDNHLCIACFLSGEPARFVTGVE